MRDTEGESTSARGQEVSGARAPGVGVLAGKVVGGTGSSRARTEALRGPHLRPCWTDLHFRQLPLAAEPGEGQVCARVTTVIAILARNGGGCH